MKEILRIYLVGDIGPILPFDQAEDIHGKTMLKWLLVSHDKYTPHGQDDCRYCLNYDCSSQCPFKKDFGWKRVSSCRSPYTKYLITDSSNEEQKRGALEMAMYVSQYMKGNRQLLGGDLSKDVGRSAIKEPGRRQILLCMCSVRATRKRAT